MALVSTEIGPADNTSSGNNWLRSTFDFLTKPNHGQGVVSNEGTSVVPGNSGEQAEDDFSLDISGYDQADWDLAKTKELLEEQRAYNSAEAAKNREWQERMSNTAYQRAVQDLEAAGLNKWLAITGGNGASASTPSGSTATSSSGDASTPNPILAKTLIQAVTSVINSAMGVLGHMVPKIKI